MATKVIIIALAFVVMGGTLALSDGTKQQAGNRNVHSMNYDRCPYYPSPVFCRGGSQAHEQDQLGHDADGR